jgi:predicted HicB family RNase H-like nuclease
LYIIPVVPVKKVTLNMDPELYRRLKIRAAELGATVTALVERAINAVLDGRVK